MIQLLFGQGRLQVDPDLVFPRFHFPHIGTGGEDYRAGDAKVGEDHFPEIPEDVPAALIQNGKGNVFKGQSLSVFRPVFHGFQRYQGRSERRHRVSKLLREPIAVPCGTGCRIGQAAGCQNHAV